MDEKVLEELGRAFITDEAVKRAMEDTKVYRERFVHNRKRTQHIIGIYRNLIERTKSMPSAPQAIAIEMAHDLLRMTVVFAHSSLEDFLRTLSRTRCDSSDPKALKNVALVGSLRAEKFSLVDLVAHRGKSVADLIDESIDGYFAHRSFNNIEDVAEAISSMKLVATERERLFPLLSVMIKRRHQIVHRADVPQGASAPEPLGPEEVSQWVEATTDLVIDLLQQASHEAARTHVDKLLPELAAMAELPPPADEAESTEN